MRYLVISLLMFVFTALQADLASILEPISLPSLSQHKVRESVGKTPITVAQNDTVPRVSSEKKIEKKIFVITWADVSNALKEQLFLKYELKGDFRMTPATLWSGVRATNPDWSVELNYTPPDGISSRFVIGFAIYADGQKLGEWKIPVQCELWNPILVAKEFIRRGAALDRSMFEEQSIDTLRVKQDILPRDVEIDHYESAHAISVGRPLLWTSVIEKPHIRKGQVVELVAKEGMMRITTKGQALQNGLVGEFISIRNLKSRKDIQAQILDENTVQVYF